MILNAKQLINGQWISTQNNTFKALDPVSNQVLLPEFCIASKSDVDLAVMAASNSFVYYSTVSDQRRAELLTTIARELKHNKDDIINRCISETGLSQTRLESELLRTTSQLLQFAELISQDNWRNPVYDHLSTGPNEDTRLFLNKIPLGPVAVFSASNFPLAFSVAGGDTASALAAGCPVVIKSHPAHPGTSELVAQCILTAIKKCDLPAGIFNLLHSDGYQLGQDLITHPQIKAAGFTGSIKGGRALFDLAVARPEPIPFFGELGSTNPAFLLPDFLAKNTSDLANDFITALTMGAGQFCTNPGILVACKSDALNDFIEKITLSVAEQNAKTMLSSQIHNSYARLIFERSHSPSVDLIMQGHTADDDKNQAQVSIFSVSAADYLADPTLEEEIFGPTSLLIICNDQDEMVQLTQSFSGHLTASIFSNDINKTLAQKLVNQLQYKVGRLVFNNFATGVALSKAMSHGGPYPASTNISATSVGSNAINRFLRPICFQDLPEYLTI